MTKERFIQIACEENFPDAELAWDNRPDWADGADDEMIRGMIRAVVAVTTSPEFLRAQDRFVNIVVAQEKASRN